MSLPDAAPSAASAPDPSEFAIDPREETSAPRASTLVGVLAIALLTAAGRDWLIAPALASLWLGWRLLDVGDRLPVLALAFVYQWSQVTCAFLYRDLTGRAVPDLLRVDHEPMVLLALGALLSLAAGLRTGIRPATQPAPADPAATTPLPAATLAPAYVAVTLVNSAVQQVAGHLGSLNQPVLIIVHLVRFGLLFLLLRAVTQPRPRAGALIAVLALETAFGLTGYFAHFRDGLFLAGLVLLERFDRRRLRSWLFLGGLATATLLLALLWTGIKEEYRRMQRRDGENAEVSLRFRQVADLSERWLEREEGIGADLDRFVSRLWGIAVQARALERVPAMVAHTDGAIVGGALRHVLMPRIFFPEKRRLDDADNEMVVRYAGVRMTARRGTSIAFGYVAESYVDFGLVGMFVPIFLFGLFMGWAYRALGSLITNEALRPALRAGVFWPALYLYEHSWTKMLGTSVALLIMATVSGKALDAWLRRGER